MSNETVDSAFDSGVRGVLDAYKTSLAQLELFGPTNFAPIINKITKLAATAQLERSARVSHEEVLSFL